MEDEASKISSILDDRINARMAAENSAESRQAILDLCKDDILWFFKMWLFTSDPRKQPSDLPFIPYGYQEQFIKDTFQAIQRGEDILVEKTRDMGVTWCTLGVFLYCWLFYNYNFLVGSRVEGKVDTIGDMDSHFERIRYMIKALPVWMTEQLGYKEAQSGYMKIYKDNGASIVGESMSPNFSRQGRYKGILLDEFAFVDKAELIWRSCGESSPCKIVVSTPNGSYNFFANLRKSGKIKVLTFHWKLHPEKDEAWYAKKKEEKSAKDLAQEIDINYSVSAGEAFYKGFSRGLHLRRMNVSNARDLVLSFDYGFMHPNCSIHQITSEGYWIIVDNIFGENQTIEEFGEDVRNYLNLYYAGYTWNRRAFGDPAGCQSSDKSRLSSQQILRNMGFPVTSVPSNSALTNYAARKTIIEKKLRTLKNGIPELIINDVPNNNIIVEGFEGGYRYPDATKYGGIAEHPVEDGWFEHPFNTIEYFAINVYKAIDNRPKPTIIPRTIGKKQEMSNAGFSYGA